MTDILRVPAGALPADRQARHSALRTYFCDKDATATEVNGEWRLELAWPGDPERHVDPRIDAGLRDWNGIALSEMATAQRRSGRVLTCLYDTWTLESWSEWLVRSGHDADDPVTILHIDDHRDLGSPRLALDGTKCRDLITGAHIDVYDPQSVRASILSGAIGMGSFLTPFLRAMPKADVRHLVQPPKHASTSDYYFRPSTEIDRLIAPGIERPAISLEPHAQGPGPGSFRATNDLGDWLRDLPDGPVLLHVDMDYFNNRYDGDGDWMDRRERLDPPIEAILERIDEVGASLRDAGVIGRIEDAVIAFSPGFFPAEIWRSAGARIQDHLKDLYG